jgi:hypothetical protein
MHFSGLMVWNCTRCQRYLLQQFLMVIPIIVRMNTVVLLKINPESYLRDALEGVIDYTKVGVRLNPSLHNAQGMMLDEETIQPTNTHY